jgi:hypothetical protein
LWGTEEQKGSQSRERTKEINAERKRVISNKRRLYDEL